jgi:cytochrome c oxidase cbb3-type subunit I/II
VKPYTPLELAGRDIYVSEGCYNCHSQMIRPIFAETERYGEYSKPGEFVYDHPFQWGSRRIGPDLAREGGKQSHLWHLLHFRDPAASTPKSVMPSYAHLERTRLAFSELPARVEAATFLGAEYAFDIADADDIAREQARRIVAELVAQQGPDRVYMDPDDPHSEVVMLEETQVIALIAYLQRLGTDLYAVPEPARPSTDEVASLEGAH